MMFDSERLKRSLTLGAMVIAVCALALIAGSCGSDDPVDPNDDNNNNTGDVDPAGTWDVTWSNMVRDCPADPIADVLIQVATGMATPVTHQWQIAMQGVSGLVVKQEPVCLAAAVTYDPTTRRCNENLAEADLVVSKEVIDEICDVITCPPEVVQYKHMLKELRVSPRRQPDVTWAADFGSFSGTYTLSGEVSAVAIVFGAEVVIPLGNCSVTWDLDGARCDSCVPKCP